MRKAIKELERMAKRKNLQGNRPYVAVQMQKEVYQMELARALKGLEPVYKWQWYSDDVNDETKPVGVND